MRQGSRSYRFVQWFLRCFGRIVWGVRAEGRERIPPDGALIVAPTHESYLDPLFVGAFLPRGLRYMARNTLFIRTKNGVERRRRLMSAFGRWALVIELDREGSDRDAIRKCLAALAAGDPVLIFPEGTRSPDGSVREFRPGVALLALRSGAPVVPVSVDGTHRIWGKGMRFPRLFAGPVRIVYGEPVRYERPAKAEDVAADIRRRVLDLRAAGQGADARDGADAHGVAGGGPSA